MNENPSPAPRWAAIWSEPLVWFTVLGTALGAAWILPAPADTEIIRIESETQRALERQQEDLLGRPLIRFLDERRLL